MKIRLLLNKREFGLFFLSKSSTASCSQMFLSDTPEFRHVIMVTDPAYISCRFYSSDALMTSTCIRAINNDNSQEVEQPGYGILAGSLAPNKVCWLSQMHFYSITHIFVEWLHLGW